ncbi:circularly permuted type 2 ATP-grasp protein [Cognatishimia sp. F0-27]|uniref:circularly permuted type 2 ATP-grasp protein n=1 Tax=Cognatishimia sp. F0-27 TaxID=2816855 RepID=UPI001D0C9E0B|nr:circularly permuted type 2 ATP-grasp protein [Cognatishimia sp. F0-27]MCC1492493.1 circularly permuted type 2 ATP-grasp protein [Cognatishimia sp. F0-27]
MPTPPSFARGQIGQSLLASYTAQGAAQNDEMLHPDGTIKPVWAPFFDHLSRLSQDDLATRFSRGDQYLRDAGVLFRQYDETLSTEREWPLSHIPVIIGEDEWRLISEGLIERANLLEFILQDFYGDNTLVTSGQLPAKLLSQNPAWLRPMVGVGKGGAHLLNTVSFEIGRGPDGQWWVISDLIEAPSSVGFAVENRIAMGRTFPNFFARANIHRLAGYFQEFQQMLMRLRGRDPGEVALLSPGPMNQNYAEHAYLARYLGLLLVEGEDLIVQQGKVMVRTVAGLKPVGLLWNRLPSAMSDPLELDSSSMLGAAGLVEAIRTGALRTVNTVGAGVLETRALMAFFPRIARERLGRALALPNIATWWCGQDGQRDHVISNMARMMVGDAFSTVPLMADPSTMDFGDLSDGPRATQLADTLRTAGHRYVGQEAVTLSRTPVWENGQLVARPICIRISMGRTKDGWAVMPGGYARISAGNDAKALAMQRGGKVADVWVTSPKKVETPSLLSVSQSAVTGSLTHALLPSRAADNLFWLGRYVERAEQNMRLFRAYFARICDGANHADALPVFIRDQLMTGVAPNASAFAVRFGEPLDLALQAASRIRDRFSPDGMMALRGLVKHAKALDVQHVPLEDTPVQISGLLRQVTGFAGLVHENMYRSDGWRFLSIGISLERAANMCDILAACVSAESSTGALDLALELGDSVVSHRTRFQIAATAESVVDLMALDPSNPRAVRYHITRSKKHIANLPTQHEDHHMSHVARQVLLLETQLATSEPEAVSPDALRQIKTDIWSISDTLNAYHLA